MVATISLRLLVLKVASGGTVIFSVCYGADFWSSIENIFLLFATEDMTRYLFNDFIIRPSDVFNTSFSDFSIFNATVFNSVKKMQFKIYSKLLSLLSYHNFPHPVNSVESHKQISIIFQLLFSLWLFFMTAARDKLEFLNFIVKIKV